jgi:hypothetical protein
VFSEEVAAIVFSTPFMLGVGYAEDEVFARRIDTMGLGRDLPSITFCGLTIELPVAEEQFFLVKLGALCCPAGVAHTLSADHSPENISPTGGVSKFLSLSAIMF